LKELSVFILAKNKLKELHSVADKTEVIAFGNKHKNLKVNAYLA